MLEYVSSDRHVKQESCDVQGNIRKPANCLKEFIELMVIVRKYFLLDRYSLRKGVDLYVKVLSRVVT
jgi:hypothetical protein